MTEQKLLGLLVEQHRALPPILAVLVQRYPDPLRGRRPPPGPAIVHGTSSITTAFCFAGERVWGMGQEGLG